MHTRAIRQWKCREREGDRGKRFLSNYSNLIKFYVNRCGRCTPLFSVWRCLPVCRQLNFETLFALMFIVCAPRTFRAINLIIRIFSIFIYLYLFGDRIQVRSIRLCAARAMPFISCFRLDKPKHKSPCGWCECFESQQLVRNLVQRCDICVDEFE